MKYWTFILFLIGALLASAQPTNKPTFIKGTIDIRYLSRASSPPTPGIKDRYTLNLNMSDSSVFRGTIDYAPIIAGAFDRVSQAASLNFQLECDVVNPANPSQTKNVGRMYGLVPISPAGVYNFNAGTLKVSVYPIGRAQGFESKFTGTAAGKPLIKPSVSLVNRVKQEALSLSRSVKGQTVAVAVKSYDIMSFNQHKIGAGPVQYYPDAVASGTMIYDRDRVVWFFKDLTLTYSTEGRQMSDKLSGNIRWIESPHRKRNGEGEYQFDVRVNEPPPNEANVFAGASDEKAFFETDDSIPALTGTMKYKDTFNGETVTASAVAVDLTGNKLTRQQTMNLLKLILLSSVVPMNAE
jgi:hypothetical protein